MRKSSRDLTISFCTRRPLYFPMGTLGLCVAGHSVAAGPGRVRVIRRIRAARGRDRTVVLTRHRRPVRDVSPGRRRRRPPARRVRRVRGGPRRQGPRTSVPALWRGSGPMISMFRPVRRPAVWVVSGVPGLSHGRVPFLSHPHGLRRAEVLARPLGRALAPEKVRFNALCPGCAESRIIDSLCEMLTEQRLEAGRGRRLSPARSINASCCQRSPKARVIVWVTVFPASSRAVARRVAKSADFGALRSVRHPSPVRVRSLVCQVLPSS